MVLALVSGLWLVDVAGYSVTDGWLVAALAALVVAAMLGALGGRRPRHARTLAERRARGGDLPTPELRKLLDDRLSLALNAAAGLAALVVLALMVWRPGS